MHPIIVVDGPDGAGKTTLGNELVKLLGAKYLHLTYRWGSKMNLYHEAALFYILRAAQTQPVVLDRWWMSELAYANVYRGGSKWPLMYRMFEKAAIRHSIVYVMCRPRDLDAYVRHFQKLKAEREEMYSDKMEQVWANYAMIEAKLRSWDHPHLFSYDWMTHGHEVADVAKTINEFAHDVAMDVHSVSKVPWTHLNLTGSWNHAKYLLVGDELKPKTRREVYPFFEYGHSSLWLMQTLEDLNKPEHDFVFINAKHHNQDETDATILKCRDKGLRVVSMGHNALKHLDRIGVLADKYIKHPQYYTSFNREEGVQAFKEALA